jgi:hypothetical protein
MARLHLIASAPRALITSNHSPSKTIYFAGFLPLSLMRFS